MDSSAGGAANPTSGTATAGDSAGGNVTGGLRDLKLDDSFPWFVATPGQQLGSLQSGEGDGTDKVLHVALTGEAVTAAITTHNHFNELNSAKVVKFAAKATADVTLQVSVQGTLTTDYFADRDAGHPGRRNP